MGRKRPDRTARPMTLTERPRARSCARETTPFWVSARAPTTEAMCGCVRIPDTTPQRSRAPPLRRDALGFPGRLGGRNAFGLRALALLGVVQRVERLAHLA